jgi:hypothetical protein
LSATVTPLIGFGFAASRTGHRPITATRAPQRAMGDNVAVASQDWIEVVPPLPLADARRAFERWRSTHPEAAQLNDEDIRIDLMRTMDGDRVRYLIRQNANSGGSN